LYLFLGVAGRDRRGEGVSDEPEGGQPGRDPGGSIEAASGQGGARPIKSEGLQREGTDLHSRDSLRRLVLKKNRNVHTLITYFTNTLKYIFLIWRKS